ncbi:MAG: methylmalonyl-CoA epimerase [Gammaproteobacteria bacterium]|jgi:methylmalonyl-CoA/ethylmalonyl-CoA epimerase|nr:methylmalonyl-CoA epimerase [Gammaproteobacteria bacterium]MBT3868277.1 methylmalonyl-CoA epimerase [Gammaproteobacteria bacterium]MBT4377684.1 methylmalonyl-CoA epimerase [Gammaproteobacteria bacterium]MBT4615850.1 methylmalonyl-CoA epimerase [Gammaproteobacteria bacterium]MBT5196861.1 methylmalonyl-CoA epimerase [Gammaproteobacteria bacterium]|tara:strand:- start:760 stop:1170 length:411 start_codon:yes stop_codon:yes gene_type:complete
MIVALDHIAIAVPDLQRAIDRFLGDFGLTFEGTENVEAAKTTTAFFPIDGTSIELVHPLDGQGPLVQHLEKRGPGIHHLCFRSDNLDEDVVNLKDKGYRFLSDEPSVGAHNTRVIFIHPKSCDGVLIELNEYPEGH